MPAYRRTPRSPWRFRKWIRLPDGKRIRIYGKPTVNTKKAAEAAERLEIEKYLDPAAATRRRKEQESNERPNVPTIAEYIVTYLGVTARDGAEMGREAKRRILKVDIAPEFGHLRLDELQQIHVDDFKTRLLEGTVKRKRCNGRAPLQLSSVNNILCPLGTLLKYARKHGMARNTNHLIVNWKTDGTEIFPISDSDFDTTLAHCDDQRYRVAMLLGRDAGLRIGEIRALRWSDIDEERKVIRVARAVNKNGNLCSTKGKKGRFVPLLIDEELHQELRELMPADCASGYIITNAGVPCRHVMKRKPYQEHLRARANERDRARAEGRPVTQVAILGERGPCARCVAKKDKPLTYSAILKGICRVYEFAGVEQPEMPWHCLRHAFCTRLANSGAPIHYIMKVAGHKSIETTRKYMHANDEVLAAAMYAAFAKPIGCTVGAEQPDKSRKPL